MPTLPAQGLCLAAPTYESGDPKDATGSAFSEGKFYAAARLDDPAVSMRGILQPKSPPVMY